VIPLDAEADTARDAVRRARAGGRDIFLHKQEFSCFMGNPATEALIEALEADLFVVYGVALDVCVKAAVEGMLDRGRTVWVVDDATWGLGLEEPEALLRSWEERGARRILADEVVSLFPLPPAGS
jgi:nicotinamidase-related amidase